MAITSPDSQRPAPPAGTNTQGAGAKPAPGAIEPQARLAMICDAAYFLAERRGFAPGHELDDWLVAETEIDRTLAAGTTATDRSG